MTIILIFIYLAVIIHKTKTNLLECSWCVRIDNMLEFNGLLECDILSGKQMTWFDWYIAISFECINVNSIEFLSEGWVSRMSLDMRCAWYAEKNWGENANYCYMWIHRLEHVHVFYRCCVIVVRVAIANFPHSVMPPSSVSHILFLIEDPITGVFVAPQSFEFANRFDDICKPLLWLV